MSSKRQNHQSANHLIAQSPNQLLARVFELQRDEHDEPHPHPWHQLLLSRSGILRTRTPGDFYFIPSNRAALIPAGTTHESWALTDADFAGIYFDPALYAGSLETCRIIEVTKFLDALIGEAIKIGSRWNEQQEAKHKRIISVLMDQLIASPEIDLSITIPDEKRLNSIVRELLTNPGSQQSLADWARTVGASERTISRLFQKLTGLSFARWRQKLRMVSALSMLEEGQAIQQIAHNVGYSSASAFIHCFRKEFGTTPQRYYLRSE
jgi:AraC-like DNA-binding protein